MPARPISQYVDVTVQPLYDTATIPAAGSLFLQYFASPIGGAGGNSTAAASTKNLSDTNMDLPGQLPAGQNFAILGFRVQPSFRMTQADAGSWSTGGWFLFTVGQKPYLRVPIDTIPAGVGPFGFYSQTAAATAALTAHGYPELSNGFTIGRKPLELSSSTNFAASLNWTALRPVTSTEVTQPAAGLTVRVYLDGFFYRAVQ